MRGDVKVRASDPDALAVGQPVRLRAGTAPPKETTIVRARAHGRGLIVGFAGIDGVEDARALAGVSICVAKSVLAPLPAGWYRHADLVGLAVEDARLGVLGRVIEVRRYPSCAMLVVDPGERLVPLLAAYGASVDLAAATIHVRLPEGFDEIG